MNCWVHSLLALSLLGGPALAQEVAQQAVVEFISEAPLVDGRLDDSVWSKAQSIGPLTQVEPEEAVAPSERTEVKLLFDRGHLYIGIMAYDSEPNKIVATQMKRDHDLDPDDRVEFILDTFLDRRNAYVFQIGPAGAKVDGLIVNNTDAINRNWDGVWEGRTQIVAGGWSAEIAIPFETLSFDHKANAWGFNVSRVLKRREELSRWASPRQDSPSHAVSDAGTISGLRDLSQGLGLELKPFAVGTASRERRGAGNDVSGDIGVDINYKVTPNLTASLTVNTDFAETEVDDRQVNLTRFPKFFPEKRDFFLQDAGIFGFGNIKRSPLPFFSRRIGLARGEEVPILAGAKLAGRSGPYNIGLLDVKTEASGGQEADNLFVARVSRNVFEQSSVGVIVTHGNPGGPEENALAGIDFTYRTSSFLGDKNLEASAFGMYTKTEGEGGDDPALGLSLEFPNDEFSMGLDFMHIGEEFNPALGFVKRRGINEYELDLSYEPRLHGFVRKLEFGFEPEWTTGTNGELKTRELEFTPLGIEFESGDELSFEITPTFERLDKVFDIRDDVLIPTGSYDFLRYAAKFSSATKRPLSLEAEVESGSFFDGHRLDFVLGLQYRPSRFVSLGLESEENHVSVVGTRFTTRLLRARLDLGLSPQISWNNLAQFDNESQEVSWNSRFRWILAPGNDIFLVMNHSWLREGGDLSSRNTGLVVKLGYTMRF